MKRALKEALVLLFISVVVATLLNLVSPNAISWVGDYPEVDLNRSTPVVPPDADEGDPPYIPWNVAKMDHQAGAVFVDARSPYEFNCGTIPGSVNIPFDYLPDTEDLGPYFDSALGGVSKDRRIVVFCSGEECDLSVHLARNLQYAGYTNLAIFYGGSREWERFGGEMEVREEDCGE